MHHKGDKIQQKQHLEQQSAAVVANKTVKQLAESGRFSQIGRFHAMSAGANTIKWGGPVGPPFMYVLWRRRYLS
jgi:hypothetical protein